MSKSNILNEIEVAGRALEEQEDQKLEQIIAERIEKAAKNLSGQLVKRVEPPLDILPDPIKDLIIPHQKKTKLPKDYYLANALSTFASAIGNNYIVRVNPDWVESSIIWITTIGPPSFGKTPVTKSLMKPIYAIEDERKVAFDKRVEQAIQEGFELDRLLEPCLYVRGGTMEGLKKTLVYNPKGILMLQDELMKLISSMDMYRSGKGGDMDEWLGLWENGEIKERLSGSIRRVRRAWVTILGNIQPGRIANLASKSKLDSGFTARLLFAYPDSIIRYPIDNSIHIDSEIRDVYDSVVKLLFELPSSIKKPMTKTDKAIYDPICLRFTVEASRRFFKYHESVIQKYNRVEEDHVKAAVGKLDRYCARFALIMELLDRACEDRSKRYLIHLQPFEMENEIKVRERNVEKAIQIMNYFEYTMNKVYNRLDNPLQTLTQRWARILYLALPDDFNRQLAFKYAKQLNKGPDSVKKVLSKWKTLGLVYKPHGRSGRYEKVY